MAIKISDLDKHFGSDLSDEELQERIKAATSCARAVILKICNHASFMLDPCIAEQRLAHK